jgi:hypothetical protein
MLASSCKSRVVDRGAEIAVRRRFFMICDCIESSTLAENELRCFPRQIRARTLMSTTKFRSQTRPPYYQIVRGWWGEGGADIEGDSECGEASRTEKYILVM